MSKGLHFRMQNDEGVVHSDTLAMMHVIGPDRLPWPCRKEWREPGELAVFRAMGDSGALVAPIAIDGFGQLMTQTAQLMEREAPYRFAVEMARGQLNRVRNQIAEWQLQGLRSLPENMTIALKESFATLRRAVRIEDDRESDRLAQKSLRLSYAVGEKITKAYAKRRILLTKERPDLKLPMFSVDWDDDLLERAAFAKAARCFDHILIPVDWKSLEPRQGDFNWDKLDQRINACRQCGIPFSVGPIIDFSARNLPDWLWLWEKDTKNIVTFLLDFVETMISRYKEHVSRWLTTARTNSSAFFQLNEEQMIWLTAKTLETATQIDPDAHYAFQIDQPWGEYLANEDRSYTPVAFADAVHRSAPGFQRLAIEVAMGYAPTGSYARSLLEFSQLIEQFERVGLPLELRLYCPSDKLLLSLESTVVDLPGSPSGPLLVTTSGAGSWHRGPSAAVQADWVDDFGTVALGKPQVQVVHFGHLRDRQQNTWPHAGLRSVNGQDKLALERIENLKRAYYNA